MQPARDPILTRSRAAAAQSGDGSGFQPVMVKEEPNELPMPADNGEGGSSEPFSAEGQGVSWSLGAPFARWFSIEEDSEDDMEGSSVGGGPSKVVKFTGSNRVIHDGVEAEELGLLEDPRWEVEAQSFSSYSDPVGEV
jgi:hypothetical protein